MTVIEAPPLPGLYLLHFEPPYRHAGHYLGWSISIERRVGEHLDRGARSSPLVRAALDAGSSVTLARVWISRGRLEERRMKAQGGLSRHCPLCRAKGVYHR